MRGAKPAAPQAGSPLVERNPPDTLFDVRTRSVVTLRFGRGRGLTTAEQLNEDQAAPIENELIRHPAASVGGR